MEEVKVYKTYIVYDQELDFEIPLGKEPYILVKTEYNKERNLTIKTFKTEIENVFYLKISKKQ